MFTSSIIAILTIPRDIIQSCIGGSGWFAKGTELSWQGSRCRSPLSPNGDYLMKTAIILLIWRRKMEIILFCNWIKKNRLLIAYESMKTRVNEVSMTLFISSVIHRC